MRFKTVRDGDIASLFSTATEGSLEETEDEAKEFDQRITEEIRWKLDPRRDEPAERHFGTREQHANDLNVGEMPAEYIPSSETTIQNGDTVKDLSRAVPDEEDRPRFSQFPAPSFRPSGMFQSTPKAFKPDMTLETPQMPTPTFISTPIPPRPTNGSSIPHRADAGPSNPCLPRKIEPSAHSTPQALIQTTTSPLPQVPTPTFISTPQLPRPPMASSTSHEAEAGPSRPNAQRKVETPINIPSPIDTPTSFKPAPGSGEGRGPRDDPATPVPLGVEKFKLLKGKKDFQTLTKHFEVFSKQTERQKKLTEEAGNGGGKGKGKGKGKVVEIATLGGKVFEGLRFCFPPELGNTSKQKTHWDIVSPDIFVRQVYGELTRIDCQKRRCGHVAA